MTDLVTAEPTYTDAHGYIVRESDGEVIGRADEPAAFAIDSSDAADWLLRKLSEEDGGIAGIDARLAAVTANLTAQRKAHERRKDYLLFRYKQQLIDFARNALTGKDRTWRGTWGTVAFRKTAGTNRITDMAAAVRFIEWHAVSRVRVERSVTVKDALDVLEAFATGTEPAWLESTGPGEKSVISTGVGKP